MIPRLVLLGYLTVGAFLVAHMANSLVADALIGPPDAPQAASPSRDITPTPANLTKLSEDVLAGSLFLVAPTEPSATTASLSGGLPSKGTGLLDAARKVKLMGTVVTEGLLPFAVIEDLATKRQSLFHLNDHVPSVGIIAAINPDSVTFQLGDIRETLDLNGPPDGALAAKAAPGTAAPPPQPTLAGPLKWTLDQREVAQNMADLPKLLSQARVGPVYADGKIDGWKVEGITPKSFFDKIGLKAGDVLQRVNGVEIRDPGMILSLFQQLKDERAVTLDMQRNGQKTTFQYEIR